METTRISRASRSAPRHALRAWPEIEQRLGGPGTRALFLDFDGTLAPLRPRPREVRCPARVKRLLKRLAQRRDLRVCVISGRRSHNLQELIGVAGIQYLGAYGAESDNCPPALSFRARQALTKAKGDLTAQLRSVPGIWVEDKGLGVAVHCRAARSPEVLRAAQVLRRALARARGALRLIAGAKVWEVVPRELAGKGAAVRAAMNKLPPGTPAVYVGDDVADEAAFAALACGITVRVGSPLKTRARYFLRSPAEVVQFLARFEEGLE